MKDTEENEWKKERTGTMRERTETMRDKSETLEGNPVAQLGWSGPVAS